jgi:hypothetical protein
MFEFFLISGPPFLGGGEGSIFCHYFTKSQVSMAMGAPKDGAKVFLTPNYEKNDN